MDILSLGGRKGRGRGDRRQSGPAKFKGPSGKAFARIRQFEIQRGLDQVALKAGAPRPPVYKKEKQRPTRLSATREASTGIRQATPVQRLPYLSAFRAKGRLTRRGPPEAELPQWEALGPSFIPKGQTYGTGGNNRPPVSGRITGIVIDSTDTDHILVASAGGGIWESHDGGKEWRPRTDFQPTLSMGAIAAAPSDPRTIYAGTGEGDTFSRQGVGVLRSRDGGATWRLLTSPHLAGRGIYDIAVDPRDARHLFAATWRDLLESVDGGASWNVKRRKLTWDLSVNPDDPTEVFAACEDGLFRSANGGRSWRRVALSRTPSGVIDRMEVCHAPSDPDVAFVFASINEKACLWRRGSQQGGFARQSLPASLDTGQAWYDWCAAVDPGDANVIYLGAINLFKGTRGRAGRWRWRNISSRSRGDSIHPDQHFITFNPDDNRVVYVANDGGLFRSPDGGTKWKALNKGLEITEFEYMAQHPRNLTWIIGGTQDNGTLIHGHNKTWNQVAPGDGGDCGVNTARPNVCYHSYYRMGLERSERAGVEDSWTWIGLPNVKSLFYPPLEVRGTVVAQGGVSIFISTTEGNQWSRVDLPQFSANPDNFQLSSAMAIRNGSTILIGTDQGRLYQTELVRGAWNTPALVGHPRKNAYVSDIFIDENQTGWIWVTYSTIGGRHVFLSEDNGNTWQNRGGGLPNIPIVAIVADPADPRTVYVGADNGVYRSTDAGHTWIDFSRGLPNAIVGDLRFHARQRVLRAATRSRGVWQVRVP